MNIGLSAIEGVPLDECSDAFLEHFLHSEEIYVAKEENAGLWRLFCKGAMWMASGELDARKEDLQ